MDSNIQAAAEMFSRLSPEAQKMIIEVIKDMVSKNNERADETI